MNLAEEETVLPVPGFEDFYLVSSYGRVFSKNYRMTGRTQELAQSSLVDRRRPSETFYRRAKMFRIDRNSPTAIHRIVALAFIPNPDGMPMVNHKDGDKGNNRAENLEWCTNAQNLRHAEATGLARHVVGEDHGCASISNEKARAVYVECAAAPKRKGVLIAIARRHGVTRDVVYSIASGKNWGCVRD